MSEPDGFREATLEDAVLHTMLYGNAYYSADGRHLVPVTDPCGGNSRGGSGCSCDPPFAAP